MYFSNHDNFNKIGFAGSYGKLMRDVEREAKYGENYLAIFTIFLDKIYGLEGNYLTFFLDTNFASEDYIIPKMSTVDMFPEFINEQNIKDQQIGYKAVISSKKHSESEIQSVLIPRFIYEVDDKMDSFAFGKMGPLPTWKADDETPPAGPKGPPKFLFQISEGFMFETRATAPRQKVIDYFSDDMVSFRNEPKYQLFAGNEIYFLPIRSVNTIYPSLLCNHSRS